MTNSNALVLRGKKIVWLGDSLTHDNMFVGRVERETGLTTLANLGFYGLHCFSVADLMDEKLIADADIVNIFAGTNDYGGARRLGTISDARADYVGSQISFHHDVFRVIKKVLDLKPHIRIVVCTPLRRGKFEDQPVFPAPNAAGYRLDEYVQAMRDVCAIFRIPVCDLFDLREFEGDTLPLYTRDNLHINAAGAEIVADRMRATLNSLSF